MWHDLLAALALMLVLEGIMPFLNPSTLRRTLLQISRMSDGTLRFVGLTCMLVGVLLLNFLH